MHDLTESQSRNGMLTLQAISRTRIAAKKLIRFLVLASVVSTPSNAALAQSYSTNPKCVVALSIAKEGSELVRQRTIELREVTADAEAKRAESNKLLQKMRSYSEAKVKLYYAFKGLRDAGYCGQNATDIDDALREFENGELGKLVQ